MTAFKTISSELVEELKNSISTCTSFTPGSDGYTEAIARWADNAVRKAAVVIQPESASDISQIINFCRTHSVDFAVSGGRHSSGGASSLENGVVIDLSKMRAVTVDADSKTCRVQGGATWAEVDSKLAEYRLAAVGGVVNHTGVGGLTLGGGYGYLASLYGLTIDNLLAATMVLADGRIVETSESQEADLFSAIRGAGQSFGVAVDFTFRCHDQKTPVWGGLIFILAEEGNVEAVVDFVNHLCEVSTGEAACYVNAGAPPFLDGKPAIGCVCFYNGPASKAVEFFAPLLKLPNVMNTTQERSYPEINSMLNEMARFGGRKVIKGVSVVPPVRLDFFKEILARVSEFGKRVPGAAMSSVFLELVYPGGWCKTPQTATAFANRGEFNNAVVLPVWKDEEDDDKCRAWAREMAAFLQKEFNEQREVRKIGGNAVGQYMNFDGVGGNGQNMFGVNYERLMQLKRVYDPNNLFNRSYLTA